VDACVTPSAHPQLRQQHHTTAQCRCRRPRRAPVAIMDNSNAAPSAPPPKVQQPKPQALPSRAGPSSLLVSPRQKGNPILNSVKAVAWEYADIPADYVVGATTCALFLSLKYHRLHPEYIYNRIRDLKGQYTLRILLTMVDIENHEDPLKELSKTSLVNNVTVMLCWSAHEAGRYLELFKTFENAAPTSIRAQQASTYAEKMVEFITVPRSINKTDAVGLVSNFGSIRTAINAGPEEIGLIAGWGEKKVQRWATAVREPFRVQKAGRRGLNWDDTRATMSRDISLAEGDSEAPIAADSGVFAGDRVQGAIPLTASMESIALASAVDISDADKRPPHRPAEDLDTELAEDEAAHRAFQADRTPARDAEPSTAPKPAKRKQAGEDLSDGVLAALSKLRKQ
jgi:DNA excision repair protein ERCC-1